MAGDMGGESGERRQERRGEERSSPSVQLLCVGCGACCWVIWPGEIRHESEMEV